MADYGELLPHVLFGDITRYAAELAYRQDDETLDRLLHDLDEALAAAGRDDEVDNLVWVSFVENAQGVPGDTEEPLRVRMSDTGCDTVPVAANVDVGEYAATVVEKPLPQRSGSHEQLAPPISRARRALERCCRASTGRRRSCPTRASARRPRP